MNTFSSKKSEKRNCQSSSDDRASEENDVVFTLTGREDIESDQDCTDIFGTDTNIESTEDNSNSKVTWTWQEEEKKSETHDIGCKTWDVDDFRTINSIHAEKAQKTLVITNINKLQKGAQGDVFMCQIEGLSGKFINKRQTVFNNK